MNAPIPLVSVILLSYNRPQYLVSAIESTLAQTWPNLEFIVVDNRSEASTEIASIVERYTTVKLIAHQTNLGFAGGMNTGLAAAQGEYVYFTEDDIVLDPNCVRTLVDHFHGRARIGLVGPIMLNHGRGTIRCAGGTFDLKGVYRMTVFGVDEAPEVHSLEPYDVMFLPGSMIMARRSLLRDLGCFRDDFFMYCEDVELCARVLKNGFSIAIVPNARVSHYEPQQGNAPHLEFHKLKNLAAAYFLHAPISVLPTFVFRYGVLGALRTLARGGFDVHAHAWTWTLLHVPWLLADRLKARKSQRRWHGPAA